MKIVGISAFYHDSAAALLVDGEIVAAAQEERFTRRKHDSAFPKNALSFCLEAGKLKLADLDAIVFYDKPLLKFERILETYLKSAPRGFGSFVKSMPVWLKEKLFQRRMLEDCLKEYSLEFESDRDRKKTIPQLLFTEHHLSHAASAFYASPFDQAVVLTMDGVGEWTTTSVALGSGRDLKIVRELHFPHSLGLLYSAFTYFAGFKVNSGEYKVMGLAPYGRPVYKDLILKHLIDLKDDGSYKLNMRFFEFETGLRMTGHKFTELLGVPRRLPEQRLEAVHMDLAASIQAVTEEVVLRIARRLRREYDIPNLCLAGGVALNCVANGKLLAEKIFSNIWIQPAAGDAGGALGAALYAAHAYFKDDRKIDRSDSMKGAYLGPRFDRARIESELDRLGARFAWLSQEEMLENACRDLQNEMALGWFQGKMEFGPRSLGARSILADARSPRMQKTLNLRVKFRESFRPFAPAVLREDVSDWFEINSDSPYMLMVARVAAKRCLTEDFASENLFGIDKLNVVRSEIPAVTHVDYSARIQTVHASTNPVFHALLEKFKKQTGCPVLVNTSFNVRGEPIVCSIEDAFRCFMGTDLDVMAIENAYLRKIDQDPALRETYTNKFELD